MKLARVENQVREFNMELEEYRTAKEKLDEENEKLKQGAKEAMSEQVVQDYEDNIRKIEQEKSRLFIKISKLENSVRDLKDHNKGLERVLNQVKSGETRPEDLQDELNVLVEQSERSQVKLKELTAPTPRIGTSRIVNLKEKEEEKDEGFGRQDSIAPFTFSEFKRTISKDTTSSIDRRASIFGMIGGLDAYRKTLEGSMLESVPGDNSF